MKTPNHPAPGKAGIASQLAFGHHWPGVPESSDDGRWLSRRHKDTEMKVIAIGTMAVDGPVGLHRDQGYLQTFGDALMCDGITRIIHGTLDAASTCLREK